MCLYVSSVYRVYGDSVCVFFFFFFPAEGGIRNLVRSRGLGGVYKGQDLLEGKKKESVHPWVD